MRTVDGRNAFTTPSVPIRPDSEMFSDASKKAVDRPKRRVDRPTKTIKPSTVTVNAPATARYPRFKKEKIHHRGTETQRGKDVREDVGSASR
jgi:hypothetical protein